MSALAKPILRGHWRRYGIKSIATALAFGTVNSIAYYLFIHVPRIRAYDEFLRTYDPEAHYKELLKYRIVNNPED